MEFDPLGIAADDQGKLRIADELSLSVHGVRLHRKSSTHPPSPRSRKTFKDGTQPWPMTVCFYPAVASAAFVRLAKKHQRDAQRLLAREPDKMKLRTFMSLQ